VPCFHGFVDNNEQYIGTKGDSQSGPQEGTNLWITQLCYEFDVLRKSSSFGEKMFSENFATLETNLDFGAAFHQFSTHFIVFKNLSTVNATLLGMMATTDTLEN